MLDIGAAASLTDAFAALDADYPELRRAGAALRLGADPQQRHARRQRRQRLADRRLDARADRARRHGGPAPRRRRRASCRSRTSTSPTRRRRCSPASSSRASACRGRATAAMLVRAPYKISKRFDQDISAVFAASRWSSTAASSRRASVAAAWRRRRSARRSASRRCVGKPWTEATARAAMAALDREFTPIDDMRASAAYRRTVRATCCAASVSRRPAAPIATRVLEPVR